MPIFRNNFGLKSLAVALAIIGWAYFRIAGNPIGAAAQNQQLSIPITATNLPLGFVARFSDHEAVVTIETKSGEPAIKPEQIRAVLDLSGKGPGIFNVPVSLVAPDVAVQSLSPASVTLTIEGIEQRSLTIAVHYVGTQSGIVVSQSQVLPQTALVRGPTSLLAQVAAVRAEVALPNQPKAIDEMVRVIGVDSTGAEVPGLSLTPNLVRVQLRLAPAKSASQ